MLPLSAPNLSGNEGRYLAECIETGFVSSVGAFVSRFEDQIAKEVQASGSVATASGTTAIHLALATLGVGRDDLVILPSFTFIASANAISHTGATPWLMDIEPETMGLNPLVLRHELDLYAARRDGTVIHKPSGRRVAAILPVYAVGIPADMDALTDIAKDWGLPVIADAAAALGASYKGRPIGKLGATLSAVSFNGNKTVTSGGGGVVFGNDDGLLLRARHLSTTARIGLAYEHDAIGYNFRMTNLQAAVGCAQMEQLHSFLKKKRLINERYEAELSIQGCFEPLVLPSHIRSPNWLSIMFLSPGAAFDIDEVIKHLRGNDIDARPFWRPVHMQRPYEDAPKSPMKNTEALWQRVLTLPSSSNLTQTQQDQVIGLIQERFGRT